MKLTDPELIAAITSQWQGERDAHGRPRVPDAILQRMQRVTTEEAWEVLDGHGYQHNFAGDWTVLFPERVLVGRAITCRWIPLRPELHETIMAQGEAEGRIGFPNSWVIDAMVDGDVLVADLFGRVNLVGDNLTTAIKTNGGRGMVIDGGLRDLRGISQIADFCTYVRRIHPEGIPGVTMPNFNGVTRIGEATCIPGDIVLGTRVGVIFIPPHLAEEVVQYSKGAAMTELRSRHLILRHDAATGLLLLTRPDQQTPSLRFRLPPGATATSDGDSLVVQLDEGRRLHAALPADQPFALLRCDLANNSAAPTNTPTCRLPAAILDLGVAADQVRALGTTGLTAVDDHPGSYVFLALAQPQTRAGLVAGWTTFDRGDGILFSGCNGQATTFAAQTDCGRLLLEPGQSVPGETLALGFFDDVRLGLEQWAELTATANQVELPPQPSGYCTWYSQPHGGACDETHIGELAAFAHDQLQPYGFDYVQIDDYWQDGQRRQGPAKVFTRVDPAGPYPSGMQAAAAAIRAQDLTPGIWYMPFAGDQDDPWFADKQHWFVHREDGSIYYTDWGGGSLDLTHPEVQEYIGDLARRIGRHWGYGLFKLDGLWTGLANAQLYVHNAYRQDDLGRHQVHDPALSPFQAYRNAFALLREGAGDDVFLLGCNISQNMRSFGAAIGRVDAMRIGPDNGSTFAALKEGPWHGSNRWFLHRRVWYNDPDPLYVRSSMPLAHARLIASWVAVTGTLHASSEWLPGLPPERLELIKRALPAHSFVARPVDVLDRNLARIWTVADPDSGRRVVGLFNWDDEQPARIECDLEYLDLPGDQSWIGREFWSGAIVELTEGKLIAELAPGSCQVLALRPVTSHPQIIASSRHITQGLTDLTDEFWRGAHKTLGATTALVGGDPTVLAIDTGGLVPADVALSTADRAAGVTATGTGDGAIATITLTAPDCRTVSWSLQFTGKS